MPTFSKVPTSRATALLSEQGSRLIDLRSPEMFRAAFIPGSYNASDLACLRFARQNGLFADRDVYLLADHPDRLQLFSDFGAGFPVAGWLGSEALAEWRKYGLSIDSVEAINADTLATQVAAVDTLILDIVGDSGEPRSLAYPAALQFAFHALPLALDGLPVETPLCVTASSNALSSFATSLLWNFGFHRISYLLSACRFHTAVN
jgi:hypothetical protein